MKCCATTWVVLTITLLVVLTFVATNPVYAASTPAFNAAALIKEAEGQTANHVRRVQIQADLHQHENALSPAQRWHLRLLDAREFAIGGQHAKARPLLHDIIDNSGDLDLRMSASTVLVNIDTVGHRYVKAYALVNKLTARLPSVTNTTTLVDVLAESSQMLASAGQTDLSLDYARQLKAALPAGNKCFGYYFEISALAQDDRISADDPLFKAGTDDCRNNKQAIFTNDIRFTQVRVLLKNKQPDKALALLQHIAPSVHAAGYPADAAWLQTNLATAYLAQGKLAKAKRFAHAGLASAKQRDDRRELRAIYKLLYQAEKTAGNNAAALAWHEKYLTQDLAAKDDTKARALAFQTVKQNVVAKKLKLDSLSKQNKVLQLQQALAAKSAETSRLYIALLLLIIAVIVAAMIRLRRSQLRFRKLARHDGLTGAVNRQHFLEQAQQTLDRLHTTGTSACLVQLDLDHFKNVNDTYGHAAGDDVLTRVVAICGSELRASDIFGRLGGEEFGILMPDCSCAEGSEITHRIRATLAATATRLTADSVVRISASFGLACTSTSGYALPELLSVADAALYRAKDAGRNQLVIGNDDGDCAAREADTAPA